MPSDAHRLTLSLCSTSFADSISPANLTMLTTPLRRIAFALTIAWLAPGADCFAARFITFLPQTPDAASAGEMAVMPVDSTRLPTDASNGDSPWGEYLRTWQTHFQDPADPVARQRLGIAKAISTEVSTNGSEGLIKSFAPSLRVSWKDPIRIDTEHFAILADVDAGVAKEIAIDLERFHAVWTQLFFPLWKDRGRWDQTATPPRRDASRSLPSAKMRVVIFRDQDQYASALAGEGPAIGRSTGYYSATARITFLRHQPLKQMPGSEADESRATLYHELTHQLLAEATDSKLKTMPGERGDFWLAEGIACYMESTVLRDGFATVGGWESSRLQFARHRVLATGDAMPLSAIKGWGRRQFQQQNDLARNYALAAAHSHRLIDHQDGDGLADVLTQLARLYQIRQPNELPARPKAAPAPVDLGDYLRLDDERLSEISRTDLINLCLVRCDLSPQAISRIAPQTSLVWLDLTGLAVTSADVIRLCPTASTLKQLSLEATAIDDSIATWIGGATDLRELDLSWTRTSDTTLAEIDSDTAIHTLWLTGSRVSDAAIAKLAAIKSLKKIDLQRTLVTDAGRQQFRSLRPDVSLDPLELVPAP